MSRERFPGEVPDGSVASARLWIDVYSEMLTLVTTVLAAHGGDAGKLALKKSLFERRLAFWKSELERLTGAD